MAAPKKNKYAKGNKGGRPSNYRQEFCEQVFKLCLLGATDMEIANFFDVCEDTINRWKKDHKEFYVSIKRGKIEADANVASSLYKKATGFEIDAVKIFNDQGVPLIVPFKEYYPPDTAAANIWLKNRRGRIKPDEGQKWSDKQEIGFTDGQGKDVMTVTIVQPKDDD